jgi:hypothetical protein|tara:strand:+ start:3325 stop:3813 length:489 start_codon:yes stop_codon:yes gene_type:complete
MVNEKDAKKVFEKHQSILEITRARNNTTLILGKFLHEMLEDNKYETISGEDTSFASYLADPEVNISRSTAYRYVGIYRKFVLELGIPLEDLQGLDIIKLDKIQKVVNKKNVKKWLSEIAVLSRSDLTRLIKYPDTDPMKCDHKWSCHKEKCDKCGEIRNIRK